jgi:putative cardiolipin synthase
MHNKSFTVDNQSTIIGGRNVGDEYFDAGQDLLFVDLDVMAIGPVVNEVSQDFDRYWASDSSYPVERILPRADPQAIAALSSEALLVERDPAAAEYTQAIARLPFVRDLQASRLALEWAATRMVSDDPAKGLGRATDEVSVTQRLRAIRGASTRELELISPYFVPTAEGVEALIDLARRNVDIAILTNSLEATDVAAVHAGYAKRRRPLLENGIALYEMKRTFSSPTPSDRGLPGSSGSSLHAKTFSVDRSRVFIGSFNFDPRSAHLNTENGFVIESPATARVLADAFISSIPERAYEVRLSETGSLQWVERRNGETLIHDKEPGAGFWRRVSVFILSLLPIEWLL